MPVPELPEVIVSHVALLDAVHPQPLPVVTEALCAPPVAELFCDIGDTLKLHAPLWLTVTVWPATVNVPLRGDVDVFAATV